MRKILILLIIVAGSATGCRTANVWRVQQLEGEITRLETQLTRVKEYGLDPETIEMSEDLRWEIEYLAVYPPYFQTALAIFPGVLFPGLGAHAIGDPDTGWTRLGQAYTGVGQFALGTGMTAFSLAAAAGCASSDSSSSNSSSSCDGIFEMFVIGVHHMVAGPANYIDSWLGDISTTYHAHESLARRVHALKRRYARFMADYETARCTYQVSTVKSHR